MFTDGSSTLKKKARKKLKGNVLTGACRREKNLSAIRHYEYSHSIYVLVLLGMIRWLIFCKLNITNFVQRPRFSSTCANGSILFSILWKVEIQRLNTFHVQYLKHYFITSAWRKREPECLLMRCGYRKSTLIWQIMSLVS